METDIKVSIIIPNHRDTYLQETLDSVKAQTYKDYELIVVTDEDVDGGGLNVKVNYGVSKAKGDAILVLCDDDTIEPEFLEETVPFIEDYDLVYTGLYSFGDGYEKHIPPEVLEDNLINRNQIYISTLFTKKIFEKVGGWDKRANSVYYDWNFWCKCLKVGAKYKKVNQYLFNYRMHNKQGGLTEDHEYFTRNTIKENIAYGE